MRISILSNGGYMPGGFTSDGGEITGQIILATPPTLSFHVPNKQYVDNLLTDKLDNIGGTITGPLILTYTPENNLEAVTKQYVDTSISTHSSSTALHLKSSERNLLDNLQVTHLEVNNLSGSTSNIQSQLNNRLLITGGTLTNFLTLHADPSTNLHATTKQYVDTNVNLKLNKAGDTMTGFLTLSGNPTHNNHAATKSYTDNLVSNHATDDSIHLTPTQNTLLDAITVNATELNHVSGVTSNIQTQLASKLSISGGTLTGALTLAADPVSFLQPATKQYVDTNVNLKLNKAGDTMTGFLTLSGNPTLPFHASTKQYTDSIINSLNWNNITSNKPTTLAGYGITDGQPLNTDLTAISGISTTTGLLKKNNTGVWSLDTNSYITGNQTITVNGDLTGSGTTAITLALNNSGVVAGSYGKVTVNSKGIVTAGSTLVASDIPNLPASKITSGTFNSTLMPAFSGDMTSTAGTTTVNLNTTGVTAGSYTKVTVDAKGRVTSGSNPTTLADYGITDSLILGSTVGTALGTAASGIATTAARSDHVHPVQTTVSGNAGTATTLATARTINGTSFNGSANITTANWGTARTLTVGSTGKSVNGAGDVSWSLAEIGAVASNTPITPGTFGKVTVDAKGLVTSGTSLVATDIPNLDTSKITSGTISAARLPAFSGDASTVAGTATITLANSGVTAGSYTKVTVDAKGRVTTGSVLATTDIPSLSWSKITSDVPTTLAGYGITDGLNINGGTLTGHLTLVGNPVGALHPATKQYVDTAIQGLDTKASVKAATIGNINLTGLQTVDGVSILTGNRVLVKDQTVASQNGIYIASSTAWVRSQDTDAWSELPGAFVYVENGTINKSTGWTCTVVDGGTLNTTNITWTQFTGAGSVTAGTGITVSGNQVSLNTTGVSPASYTKVTVDANGRITSGTALVATDIPSLDTSKITSGILAIDRLPAFSGDASTVAGTATITLANSGVTAGTYTKVTVDDKGRVTSGTNPTTLADYGITDSLTLGSTVGSALGTAASGIATTAARSDHVHPVQTSVSGNAGTATTLATARTINGTSFNGGTNITTANWGTARTLTVGSTGKSVNGGSNISWSLAEIGAVASNTAITPGTFGKVTVDAKGLVTSGTALVAADIPNLDTSKITTGTISAARLPAFSGDASTVAGTATITLANSGVTAGTYTKVTVDDKGRVTTGANPTTLADYGITDSLTLGSTVGSASGTAASGIATTAARSDHVHPVQTSVSGNAGTATTLATARTINGTSFNGSANITTANWGTARTLTVGSTGKSVNGADDISWSLAEIGAVASNTPITPGTFGKVTVDAKGLVTSGTALVAADIPSLDTSKITTGTISAARLPAFSGDASTVAGTATITLANSGVTAGTYNNTATSITPITIDAKGRVTGTGAAVTMTPNWSSITNKPTTLAGYGISDAQIADRSTATFTTVANNWYRIATSNMGITRNSGEFVIDWSVSGNHGIVRFAAGCQYGFASGVSIMQGNYTTYATTGIVAARIVYHSTYSGNYAYVEVKFGAALSNVVVNVELQDTIGWTLTSPSTPGSIPVGYSNYEHTFISSANITAGTFTKVVINQEGRVTSGTALVAADIPNLDTSKITSGTISAARLPAFSGDASTVAGTATITLANSGVTAGSYTKVTVDAKGRVTSGTALVAADIPNLDISKITTGTISAARLPLRLGEVAQTVTDWNNAIQNGWYMGNNVTNSPFVGWVLGNVEVHNSIWVTQTVHGFSTDSESDTKTYRREFNSGTWTSWYRLRISELEQTNLHRPTGSIVRMASSTAPDGYLQCNGQSVSPITYANLYSSIGFNYGKSNTTSDNYISVTMGYTSYGVFGAGKYWENQGDFSTIGNELGSISYHTQILPNNLHLSGVVVTKNKVFIIGGYNGTSVVNTIYSATISLDGTLSAFTLHGTLPISLCDMQVLVTKNLCILVGGYNGTADIASVYTAAIDANGDIGTFTTSLNLPQARSGHQAFITKNRLYVIGGWSGSAVTNSVYVSTISSTGTLGAFSSATNLPISVSNHKVIFTKNRVYLLGGYNGTDWLNNTYTAVINTDGTIGAWSAGTALPVTIGDTTTLVFKNKVYLIGGYTNKNYSNRILTANIDANGLIGVFSFMSKHLPESISNSNIFITKDTVYIPGYWDGFKTSNNIMRIELDNNGLSNYDKLYDGTINKFDGVNLTGTITAGTVPTGTTLFRLPDTSIQDAEDNLVSYIKV